MPNSFITIQEIARNTLPRLLENLVFPNLIHKDFSNDFSRNLGDSRSASPSSLRPRNLTRARA